MDLYPWIVIAHVFLVIVAFGAHGYSAFAMFGVKRETERPRLAALLELSSSALLVAGIALLVSVVLGIVAAAMHGYFGRLWPWASIVIVVVIWLAMTPLAAGPMSAVRRVLGVPIRGKIEGEVGTDAELIAARARLRPELVATVGLAGILVLTWLMEMKPF
jgi:hypothetical protein